MAELRINIPDIYKTPYVTVQQVINNESYFFEYSWNIRHEKLYLSIYLLDNDEQEYLVKNMLLTFGINIAQYIINDRWSGGLFLKTINPRFYYYDYDINSISEEFYFYYNSDYLRD